MADWVKLHSKSAESEDLAALYAADPTAALVFLLALPAAAPWGILPRHPALFAARVCPLFGLSPDKSETCLRLVLDHGMFTEYQDRDGKAHLYVTAWTQNQSRQWERVGPPPCDLPPGWTPPPELAKSIAAATRGKRWLTADALEVHLQDAESKTRLRQVLEQSQTSLRREVRGEKESLDTPTPNESLSESADGALPDAAAEPSSDPPPKQTRAKRKAMTDDEATSAITGQRSRLPHSCDDAIDAMLDLFAVQNKSGAMARTRELSIVTELADKMERDGIGTDALRYGLQAAIAKGAANVNYVVKAAKGYEPGAPGGNGPPPRKAFVQLNNGARCYSDDWSLTQQYDVGEWQKQGVWNPRTGCTTEPRRGYCCDDGWYYGSHDDGSAYQERRWAGQ